MDDRPPRIGVAWFPARNNLYKENQMSLQYLERRFGITAVKKGFITADQLIEALSIQIIEELEDSEHRLIGEILFEKRYLTAAQIKEVLGSLGISGKMMPGQSRFDSICHRLN
jgi:hypothetical protein